MRLWVDRSFTVTGAGTVVTGTLPTGSVARGGTLLLNGEAVRVRGLQVHHQAVETAAGPTRVAVNLRGVPTEAVPRGTALLSPGWPDPTRQVDVVVHRLVDRMPPHVTLHVGTASAPVRVRPLGPDHARLGLEGEVAALPLVVGDRVVLRDPGAHEVLAGATVLDAQPPPLARRGDAARRAAALAEPAGPAGHAPSTAGSASAVTAHDRSEPPPSTALLALTQWLDGHPLEPAPAELLAPVRPADLAGAERAGRLVRLGGLTLSGASTAVATDRLGTLPARFSAGDAARALGTSRRVAIPVLERLDALLVTRRHADGTRTLRPMPRPGE